MTATRRRPSRPAPAGGDAQPPPPNRGTARSVKQRRWCNASLLAWLCGVGVAVVLVGVGVVASVCLDLGVPSVVGANAGRLEVLRRAAQLLNDAGVVWWVKDGTLLEAVRSGSLTGPDDRPWDVDLAIFARDFETVQAVKHRAWEEWRTPMVSRGDRWWLPSAMGFVIVRGAFRLFYHALLPCCYVDVDDLEEVPGKQDVLYDAHFNATVPVEYPLAWLLPLKQCRVMDVVVPCPAQSELWLERTYGPGWRTPKAGYKAAHFYANA